MLHTHGRGAGSGGRCPRKGGCVLTIGDRFPDFSLTALRPGDLSNVEVQAPDDFFETIDSDSHPGQWKVGASPFPR